MELERIESLAEILENLGVVATEDQIKQISEDFALHLEMESEMCGHQHDTYKEPCPNCKRLEQENKTLSKDIEAYQDSVKRRRNARDVWIDNGSVMYG